MIAPTVKSKGAGGQGTRFIKTARSLGCDEREDIFDNALKRMATVKPKPLAKKKRKTPRK